MTRWLLPDRMRLATSSFSSSNALGGGNGKDSFSLLDGWTERRSAVGEMQVRDSPWPVVGGWVAPASRTCFRECDGDGTCRRIFLEFGVAKPTTTFILARLLSPSSLRHPVGEIEPNPAHMHSSRQLSPLQHFVVCPPSIDSV
ncbi:hypothetical protein V2G26_003337 [Clonostachys chloroleuca]